MSKYTLELIDKDPKYGMQIVNCSTTYEANEIKKKAIENGFKVRVKGEKKHE